MEDDPGRLYRLDGVAHIAGVINEEVSFFFFGFKCAFGSGLLWSLFWQPQRCISSMRRQQGMPLDERYVPYLQMTGLYHLARLNDRWFQLDEPLVSAFVERWHSETHTFHMPFGECTITLQDVAYQLGLPMDGRYVSGCLTDFHVYIEGGHPAWVWFQELLGVIPPPSQVQKFAVNCTWFQETFGECPAGADEETVRRFARAYIMMLLGTQLFADKSGNRIHIRWLPYVARLEEMGTYSWGSAPLAWLYQCMCRVANRHVVKLAGPLQLLQSWIFWRFPRFRPAGYDTCSWPLASRSCIEQKNVGIFLQFIWMPYSSPEVLQVVHPEVLEPRHTAMWQSVTSLIYFAVIEWHQIDRVLPQFGGVQIWHLHWESRADHVLRFDVVADPGPSHDYLQWWSQHGKKFLSPEMYLGDPRAVPIPVEASQRGPGRVPDMDRVDDVPDRRRVERRARVGTRRSQREWRWLDQAMEEGDGDGRPGGRRRGHRGRWRERAAADDYGHHGHDDDDDQHGSVGRDAEGHAAIGGVSPHHVGHGGEWYGSGVGDGTD
ncbi:hypothetical protein Ahy_B04g071919 isoform A [Arachis hypogaea]|uniref:Aminotransferase-like plant mobile domain-containing protein n=1 Tax=Arachis hypogaea TaxID=3818 RepID=A0A444ZLX4_ARAHY|nr:hypothetical protein Ahy_B04g071919 isoform A [Arachis hypogaea]